VYQTQWDFLTIHLQASVIRNGSSYTYFFIWTQETGLVDMEIDPPKLRLLELVDTCNGKLSADFDAKEGEALPPSPSLKWTWRPTSGLRTKIRARS